VEVRDEDQARLSPAWYEHINPLDKYIFLSQVEVQFNRLRKAVETASIGA
jgi:hypothetical protein